MSKIESSEKKTDKYRRESEAAEDSDFFSRSSNSCVESYYSSRETLQILEEVKSLKIYPKKY